MVKVSVILPIYNAESFLKQTLDCLIAQTLKEIEIICVDDGSTDNSYQIIKEYSEKYENIIGVTQENAGAGAARNKGLSISKGEYLSFLDADDFFEPDMLEIAYEHAKKYNSDVTVFNSNQYYEETGEYKNINWVVRYNKIPPYNPFSHRQMTDNVFKVFVGWAWDKLFKREFIENNQLKFQEQRTSNDLLFVFSSIVLAKRISVLDKNKRLVHQRRNNKESLSNTREKSWDCFYKALVALKDRLKKEGKYEELERDYINYALHFTLWNLNSLAEPTYSLLKEKLINEWIYDLEIMGKPSNYFYNAKEYNDFCNKLEISTYVEKEKKVSIIIPMYNSAKYIRECIESVLNQTYENIEVICVDDGSTDETVDIINEYSKIDDRVFLIKQKNQYAGVARNNGMKNAHGDYLYFMDADDFIEPELIELTLKKAEDVDADVVVFDGKQFDNETKEYIFPDHYLRKSLIPTKNTFNRNDIKDKYLTFTSLCPWNKLFKSSFIYNSQLQFQSIQNTNDAFLVVCAISKAEKVAVVNKRLINYRINNSSSIQGGKAKNPTCFLDAFDAIYRKLNEWELYDELKNGFVETFLSCCVFSIESYRLNYIKKEVIEAIKSSNVYNACMNIIESEKFAKDQNTIYLKSAIKSLQWRTKSISEKNDKILKSSDVKNNIMFSVIVPVYNSTAYLNDCIDSLLSQSVSDFEIICINDGSTDNSLDILKEYSKTDERIMIIDQNNSGLSGARNTGIKYAKGEYILFLDSDDYLRSDSLEILYNKAKQDDLDILYFDGISFGDESEAKLVTLSSDYYIRKHDYSSVYKGIDLIASMELNNEYRVSACMQIIKRDYLNKINVRFVEGILHEDNIYTFQTIVRANKASHLSETLYYRRIHNDSITTMHYNFNHCYGYFKSYLLLLEEFKELKNNKIDFDDCLYDIGYRLHGNAVNVYCNMDETEYNIFFGLNTEEYFLFLEVIYRLAERHLKLLTTYEEKSEINAKLQRTYKEKAERGIEINKLKEKIKKLENK